MKILFFFLLFGFSSLTAKPMVYDCFLFLNELDVLDIRLHEMNEAVDRFVIVESVETFRGNVKPFNFAENRDRFRKFAEKIIYVQLNERLYTANPWDRETFQRNAILRGLQECKDEDVILISDVDEIVEGKGIPDLYSALTARPNECVGVAHKYHSTFLNSVPSPHPWRGTVAATFKIVKSFSPQGLRGIKDQVPVGAKGWHFTWQGDLSANLYKLGAYSHAESDTPEGRECKRRECARRSECPIVELDDGFPRYILENRQYFESIGFLLFR